MSYTVAIFFKHQSLHSSGWSQIVWIPVLVSSMTLVIIKHIIRVYFISCKSLLQISLYFREFCSSKSGSFLKWLRYFAQVSESRSCEILKELDTSPIICSRLICVRSRKPVVQPSFLFFFSFGLEFPTRSPILCRIVP